jgi:hypothetical protein
MSLYMTGGESMGPGDCLSTLSRVPSDSGEEERWPRDRSGETHRITATAD